MVKFIYINKIRRNLFKKFVCLLTILCVVVTPVTVRAFDNPTVIVENINISEEKQYKNDTYFAPWLIALGRFIATAILSGLAGYAASNNNNTCNQTVNVHCHI